MSARGRGVLYFCGATLSRIGDEMSVPALLLFGLAVSGSAPMAAAIYAALTMASAFGGPLLGLALDRAARPGAALAACLLLYGVGLTTITLTGGTVPLPVLLAVAAATGLLGPALAGGWSSQLQHVLPGQPRAYSLDVATYNLAGMAGPALAAVAATTWTPSVAMGAAVVLVLSAAPAAWLLPPPPSRPPRSGSGLVRSVLHDLREGFRPLVHLPTLRGATLGSSVSFAGVGMFVVACPLLGAERFGDPGRGALLVTVLAAASLAATLITARWPLPASPDRVLLVATALQGVGLAWAAVADRPWPTVLAIAVLGLADGPQLAAVFAIRHRDAPTGHRAQVFITAASLKVGSAALGALLAGALAGVSSTAVLLAAGGAQGVAVLAALVGGTPLGRGRATAPTPR